jgi:hypothetical protein
MVSSLADFFCLFRFFFLSLDAIVVVIATSFARPQRQDLYASCREISIVCGGKSEEYLMMISNFRWLSEKEGRLFGYDPYLYSLPFLSGRVESVESLRTFVLPKEVTSSTPIIRKSSSWPIKFHPVANVRHSRCPHSRTIIENGRKTAVLLTCDRVQCCFD